MSERVNLDMAREFLEALDPEAEYFTFQTFTDAKPRPRPDPLAGHKTGSLDELAQWLISRNERGAGVFVTVNETDGKGRERENITRARAVWQEDDGEGKPLPLEPHIEVESSPGKAHRYILVDGMTTDEQQAVQRRLVTEYGSDPDAATLERVLRVPGFYHRKGKPHQVRLLKAERFLPYPRDRVLKALPPVTVQASPSRVANAPATEYADEQTLRELRSALAWINPDGRDEYMRQGCRLRGLGDVTGRGLWLEWAQQSSKWQPADAQEWHTFGHDRTGYRAIFEEAQRNGWPNPARGGGMPVAGQAVQEIASDPRWGFKFADEMVASMGPTRWLVQKLVPEDCTLVLYGASGSLKSFVMLDMALCIANGIPWHGKPTKPRSVFYLAGEGSQGFAKRIAAWCGAHDLPASPRFAFRAIPRLKDDTQLGLLMAAIAAIADERGDAGLIVIDTLFTALDGGDENSGKDMGALISAMVRIRERFGAAVAAVHHTGKVGDTARGHSSLPSGMDVMIFAKPGPSPLTVELTNPKQKDGGEHPSMLLQAAVHELGIEGEDGQPETSLVLSNPAAELMGAYRERAKVTEEKVAKAQQERDAKDQADARVKAHALERFAEGASLEIVEREVADLAQRLGFPGLARKKSTLGDWRKQAGLGK